MKDHSESPEAQETPDTEASTAVEENGGEGSDPIRPAKRHLYRFRDRRQRFDPDAEFIWRVRRVMGHTGKGKGNRKPIYSEPGTPVDKDSLVSRNRLKMLWEAEFIELANWTYRPVGTGKKVLPQKAAPMSPAQEEAQKERAALDALTEARSRAAVLAGMESLEGEPTEPEATEREVPEGVEVETLGGGWYRVVDGDGEEYKVRGRDELNSLLSMLAE